MNKWFEKIKKLRIDKNVTQKQLGEMFGVDRATIANWEMGRRKPSTDVMKKLAEYFGVSLDYIYDMPVSDETIDNAMREIETFFMSDEITTSDKEAIFKDIFDLYYRVKSEKSE